MLYFCTIIQSKNYTMSALNDFLTLINGHLWGVPMIVLLLGTHLYLTIRLRFSQRYIFKAIRLSIKRDKGSTGDVSQFSALATSLAGTIGTGNIIGVATAVTMGGPGAVFWCWMTGVLGIATKYAEGLLAIKYRVTTKDGTMLGGPMYAIERGVGLFLHWQHDSMQLHIDAAARGLSYSSPLHRHRHSLAHLCGHHVWR